MQDLFLKTKDIPGHIIELDQDMKDSIIFGSLYKNILKIKSSITLVLMHLNTMKKIEI